MLAARFHRLRYSTTSSSISSSISSSLLKRDNGSRLFSSSSSSSSFASFASSSVTAPTATSSSSASSAETKKRDLSSRLFSSFPETEAFSIYEYPTRSEAPVVTRQTAEEALSSSSSSSSTSSSSLKTKNKPITSSHHRLDGSNDPFDDSGNLTKEEIDRILQSQQQQTQEQQRRLNCQPILPEVPAFVPPNVSSQELEAPQTFITKLDNGVRVVSQETYGQMCTIGVVTNVGSRHEPQLGIIHLLETLAFSSTREFPDGIDINERLQDWGATRFVSMSREQTLHCIDVLRPNAGSAMNLLSQVVLEPVLSIEQVDSARAVLEYQAQDSIPELYLGEALQVAAYGSDQQLGKLHFATSEAIQSLSQPTVEKFYQDNIRYNPEGMVIAGAGIGHDELVDLANKYFATLSQQSAPETIPSTYRGGTHMIGTDPQPYQFALRPPDEYCRVALAFPVGGWHSDTMVTACVLQTLLGGGSSFSAGGPGKGMYSRIYQNILNRYGWMETAEAFTTFADEGGLFGLSGSTNDRSKVSDLVTILADQLARLAVQPVTQEELMRARNMLKCNVLTQLESRLILFEDMGRQVLTYGKREHAAETCRKIDAVTPADIQALAQTMLLKAPTVAASGTHLDKVPDHKAVARLFQ